MPKGKRLHSRYSLIFHMHCLPAFWQITWQTISVILFVLSLLSGSVMSWPLRYLLIVSLSSCLIIIVIAIYKFRFSSVLRNKGKNFVLYFFPFLLTGCIREINLSRYQDERYPKEQKSLNQARRILENCKLIKLFKAKLFHICPKLKE